MINYKLRNMDQIVLFCSLATTKDQDKKTTCLYPDSFISIYHVLFSISPVFVVACNHYVGACSLTIVVIIALHSPLHFNYVLC